MTLLRPLLPADVPASYDVTYAALSSLDEPMPERTPEHAERSQARIRHLQQTDPDSAWVAEEDEIGRAHV